MTKKEIKTFSKNLIRLKTENNLSNVQMAKICGISEEEVSEIENGKMPPEIDITVIVNLSKYFKIEPGDLFTDPVL